MKGGRYDAELLIPRQEIPVLPLQVGAQGRRSSKRADTWSEGMLSEHTWHIPTDVEGSRGQVLELWRLTGLIHVNIN